MAVSGGTSRRCIGQHHIDTAQRHRSLRRASFWQTTGSGGGATWPMGIRRALIYHCEVGPSATFDSTRRRSRSKFIREACAAFRRSRRSPPTLST